MSGISSMMFANFAPPVSGGGGGGGDDGYASILFHFEGSNGSTTIDNSITSGPTFTHSATLSSSKSFISTADYKFGTSSFRSTQVSSSGASQTGIYPSSKALVDGSWIPRDHWWTNDTTVESWVYVRANSGGGQFAIWYGIGTPRFNAGFWNTNSGASMSFEVEISTSGNYSAGSGGSGYYNLKWTIGNGILNSWAHIALVRTGNALKLFINGTDKGTGTLTTGSGRDSTNIFLAGSPYVGTGGSVTGNLAIADIGGAYTDYGFRNSNMDDFRFSNAIARYTADFTAPTSAFTDT